MDGLRGVAVLAVLLFHGEVSWARGGFLGVSLFFTLSGFLITTLLLSEHTSTGAVRLSAFWIRRGRRLLPASLAALLLATITIGVVIPAADRGAAVIDVRAALLNVANWRFILADQPYLQTGKVPSPVTHYWSLSIEEQFYLLFPLLAVLALRWRRRGLVIVLAIVTVGSVVSQLRLDDPVRIYYGTDTRASELAIGGLLACGLAWWHRDGRRAPAIVVDAVGTVALVTTLVLFCRAGQDADFLYSGGLLGVALVWAALIYAAVAGVRSAGVLGVAPLRELGKISYGVYLFHFPIYLLLTEERTGVADPALLAMRVAATLAVAVVSSRLLELPIRRGGALPGRRALAALAAGAAVVVLAAVPVVRRADEAVAAAPVGTPGITVSAPDGEVPDGVPRLLVVGDSTAETFGDGLQAWARDTGKAEVTVVSSLGCAPLLGESFRVRDGYEYVPDGCEHLLTTAVEQADQQDADAVLVLLGSSQLADWRYDGSSAWRGIDERDIAEDYRHALVDDLAVLEGLGIPILWADVPTPAWDIEAFAETLGTPLPGSGRVTLNDPARAEQLNRLDEEVIAGHSLVEIWSLRGVLAAAEATAGTALRFDGLHIDPELVPLLVEAGLIDDLQSAYRAVLDRRPPGLAVAGTLWDPGVIATAPG